jgi:ABC-type Fe3+/spermidine/putrescine transport system ATPase subunit
VAGPPQWCNDHPHCLDAKAIGATHATQQLQHELGITFIYVTHDQQEAMALSQRVAIFNTGRIEQVGGPTELYECPRTQFVARFLGESNLFEGVVDASGGEFACTAGLRVPLVAAGTPRARATALVRPEHIDLSREPTGP